MYCQYEYKFLTKRYLVFPFAHLHSEARTHKNIDLILKFSFVCCALLEVVHMYTNAVGADTLAEDRKLASSSACAYVSPFPLGKCMGYYLPRGNGILVPTL